MNSGIFGPLPTSTSFLHLVFVVHLQNRERKPDCHDVRANLAVLLVGDAGALGMDASAGLELEFDGHCPSARLLDLAGDLERIVVIGDVRDVAGVTKRKGLVENLLAAPLDQLLACDAAFNHGLKRANGFDEKCGMADGEDVAEISADLIDDAEMTIND